MLLLFLSLTLAASCSEREVSVDDSSSESESAKALSHHKKEQEQSSVAEDAIVDSSQETNLPHVAQMKATPADDSIDEVSDKDPARESTAPLIYLSISLLALATLISVLASFYLYKWRRTLIGNQAVVMPENWLKEIIKSGEHLAVLSNYLQQSTQALADASQATDAKVGKIGQTYLELQKVLDAKDAEIKRLREGYDLRIYRSYILRFARIERLLVELEPNELSESKAMLLRMFEDAFEECDLTKYQPEVGADYRNEKGVADNPLVEYTLDEERVYEIIEIVEQGYSSNESGEVLIPAKVKILQLEREE